ncbi:MAG: crosslink repair DNA glycosylase YcaQ family protein [Pseudomonadota bacterium]
MTPLKISNRDARKLWLSAQGLIATPTGRLDVMSIIRKLGFVQLDTIQVVSRAHHHILWSRNQNYREHLLDKVMSKDRALFEHFTHDASVLPMEFLPMWKRQFRRKKEMIERSDWYSSRLDDQGCAQIMDRIRQEGPLSTHAFDTKIDGEREMWARPPHKLALDYLWYSGELATCHRKNFTKYYDLAERVFPDEVRVAEHEDAVQVDWLCRSALDRLGFGSLGEVQRFWDAVDLAEVKAWAENPSRSLVPVEVESADGNQLSAVAPPDIEERIERAVEPTSRLRILNPFDPVIRNRTRLSRLFGFDYRVEMFVPAAKRVWGYYVYPILEGNRFVGRIEVKADRSNGQLNVLNVWQEPKVKWTENRAAKLEAELVRFARLASVDTVNWACSPIEAG